MKSVVLVGLVAAMLAIFAVVTGNILAAFAAGMLTNITISRWTKYEEET